MNKRIASIFFLVISSTNAYATIVQFSFDDNVVGTTFTYDDIDNNGVVNTAEFITALMYPLTPPPFPSGAGVQDEVTRNNLVWYYTLTEVTKLTGFFFASGSDTSYRLIVDGSNDTFVHRPIIDNSPRDVFLGSVSSISVTRSAVPEPSVIALMGLGLLGFVATRRKVCT